MFNLKRKLEEGPAWERIYKRKGDRLENDYSRFSVLFDDKRKIQIRFSFSLCLVVFKFIKYTVVIYKKKSRWQSDLSNLWK